METNRPAVAPVRGKLRPLQPVYSCPWTLPNGTLCGYVQRGPGTCPHPHGSPGPDWPVRVELELDPVYKLVRDMEGELAEVVSEIQRQVSGVSLW